MSLTLLISILDLPVLDPLELSNVSPWGEVLHLERSEDLYSVDGWLKNISLHGLSNIYLDTVTVTRNFNLSTINIRVRTGLEVVTFQGWKYD